MPIASNCIYRININFDEEKLLSEANDIMESGKDRHKFLNKINNKKQVMQSWCITSTKERAKELEKSEFYSTHVVPEGDNARLRIDQITNERVVQHDNKFREKVDAYFIDPSVDERQSESVLRNHIICKESDLTNYHHSLPEDSEIRKIDRAIGRYFNIPCNFRVRLSKLHNIDHKTFKPHTDPHTPWRVHICLKGDHSSKWHFRNSQTGKKTQFIQAKNRVYLVRTNTVQHWVSCNDWRKHIFWHIYHNDLVGADGTEYVADRTGELALP